jgi:cytochrome P450
MLEMVETRRTSGETEERHDLFSGLLYASHEDVVDGGVLSDDELIGEYSIVVPSRIP